MRRSPFLEIKDEEWDEIFNVLVKGYFMCSQIFGRHMAENKKGKIINISSISKYIPDFARAHYCSAKGAIGMLTKSVAYELSPMGVNVNEIVPGAIKTDIDIAVSYTHLDVYKRQSIDNALFDAAKVDGANNIQIFKSIIIPSIAPTLIIVILLRIVWNLSLIHI